MQDYEKLSAMGRDIKTLLGIGNEILKLKRALQDVVRMEDYDKAIELRNQIVQQEEKREAFDVLYETSRFESMILMDDPSDHFKKLSKQMDEQEQFLLEQQRRQREEDVRREEQLAYEERLRAERLRLEQEADRQKQD